MTDDEILKTIESSTRAASAMNLFLIHAFCTLAQQPGIDLKQVMAGIKALNPSMDDHLFQTVYVASKNQMIQNLEELC